MGRLSIRTKRARTSPQPAPPPLGKPTQGQLIILCLPNQPPSNAEGPTTQSSHLGMPIKPLKQNCMNLPLQNQHNRSLRKTDQNDFKLFSETQLSKLYRSEIQKLIKKEPLNKIGKLTLSRSEDIAKITKRVWDTRLLKDPIRVPRTPSSLCLTWAPKVCLMWLNTSVHSSENIIHDLSMQFRNFIRRTLLSRFKTRQHHDKRKEWHKDILIVDYFGTAMKAGTAQLSTFLEVRDHTCIHPNTYRMQKLTKVKTGTPSPAFSLY